MNSASPLPDYIEAIETIYLDPEVGNSPLAARVLSRLPGRRIVRTVDNRIEPRPDREETSIHLKHFRGDFLRFCPGTRKYNCCGYRIIHIGENCPLSCTYCILKAYFQDRMLKVWANQDDLRVELDKAFGANRNLRFRVGTGEFTDSLVLEPLTGYSADLVEFLSDYDNVRLELKSKVVDLSWMDKARRPELVLPAWSLNAPEITARQEIGATTLEQRLEAARTCAANGFRVCLHFDPIIHFPGWEKGYQEITDMIFDYLKPEDIAYLSLGSFRFMPELKDFIEKNHPQADYVHNEFITGLDNKKRLLRPLRVAQFKFMVKRLRSFGLEKQLYFCMESDEVWKAVFGYTPKSFGGLSLRLMDMAFGPCK